jgi:integrase/recombinase XerD
MIKFKGYLGERMREHLQLRRGLGRCYTANEGTLHKFNKLIQKRWPNTKTVTRDMVLAFLRSNRHIKTISRRNELTYIRMFCTDLAASGVSVFLPERKLLPKCTQSTRVHIFNQSEVLQVMSTAELMKNPRAAQAYSTLVGFFWITGLRLQEALSTNIGDIDWEQKLLFVRKGKYGKSRCVPLSNTALSALNQHLKKMKQLGLGTGETDPLFVGCRKTRLTKRSASHVLHNLYRAAKIKTSWGGYPRTVDLRHSFATHALKAVREDGSDPANLIPPLATILGHSNLNHTQTYLHPTMETLHVASRAFEKNLLRFNGAV